MVPELHLATNNDQIISLQFAAGIISPYIKDLEKNEKKYKRLKHDPIHDLEKTRPVDAPLDKRRKVGTGRSMTSTTSSRSRQVLAPVTTNQKEVAAAASETQVLEDETMEFTKEEVDALLNERLKERGLILKIWLMLCHSKL
ncbi:hypothetical protein Tco_0919538 [Tanacetum coccineum]